MGVNCKGVINGVEFTEVLADHISSLAQSITFLAIHQGASGVQINVRGLSELRDCIGSECLNAFDVGIGLRKGNMHQTG